MARTCPYGINEFWLGGLDSNQDNQIQSLMYYRLYDLPAGGRQRRAADDPQGGKVTAVSYFNSGPRRTSTRAG